MVDELNDISDAGVYLMIADFYSFIGNLDNTRYNIQCVK